MGNCFQVGGRGILSQEVTRCRNEPCSCLRKSMPRQQDQQVQRGGGGHHSADSTCASLPARLCPGNEGPVVGRADLAPSRGSLGSCRMRGAQCTGAVVVADFVSLQNSGLTRLPCRGFWGSLWDHFLGSCPPPAVRAGRIWETSSCLSQCPHRRAEALSRMSWLRANTSPRQGSHQSLPLPQPQCPCLSVHLLQPVAWP